MQTVPDQDIETLQAKRHWPWPLALAYVQQSRRPCVAAVSEVLITYPLMEGLDQFLASSAVARVYETVTGKTYGHDDEAYWADISSIEARLVAALEADQIAAFGRAEPDGQFVKIDAVNWVGSEVSPEKTSDLVVAGWRASGLLDQALGQVDRSVRFYDLHLIGDTVRQLADALERERNAKVSDDIHGLSFAEIEELEAQELQLWQGYWSPLIAGAWIASRSTSFVSAIQEFEKNRNCDRGHAHSGTAWWAVGDLMGARFGMTLTQSHELLREALEAGQIAGGKGEDVHTKRVRLIKRHEWTQWSVEHNSGGVFILPQTYNLGWPSDAIQKAFPPVVKAVARIRESVTDEAVLERCDQLWLEWKNVRELDVLIPKETKFLGFKAYRVRELTRGRYPRIGRGGVRTPEMINK